ncbi:unnamed protein product [Onchocerca ochengi]|uniref:Helitron_like_N domain-containing protein n=1 Tax=Onchocerca ochengi TaxID=42157 RepID=A0A182EP96_ONCOC|nr:unnamed protein product [Onchocerca ochengi]
MYILTDSTECFILLIITDPDHPRAKGNVRWYENLLEDDGVRRIDMRRNIPLINNIRHENDRKHIYEALCRHEIPVDMKAQSRLYCYYKMDHPYLRLAPFKVEIVRQNPLVVLFHDIISDEEARIIEMLAVPKACLSFLFCIMVLCAHSQETKGRGRGKWVIVFTGRIAISNFS